MMPIDLRATSKGLGTLPCQCVVGLFWFVGYHWLVVLAFVRSRMGTKAWWCSIPFFRTIVTWHELAISVNAHGKQYFAVSHVHQALRETWWSSHLHPPNFTRAASQLDSGPAKSPDPPGKHNIGQTKVEVTRSCHMQISWMVGMWDQGIFHYISLQSMSYQLLPIQAVQRKLMTRGDSSSKGHRRNKATAKVDFPDPVRPTTAKRSSKPWFGWNWRTSTTCVCIYVSAYGWLSKCWFLSSTILPHFQWGPLHKYLVDPPYLHFSKIKDKVYFVRQAQ